MLRRAPVLQTGVRAPGHTTLKHTLLASFLDDGSPGTRQDFNLHLQQHWRSATGSNSHPLREPPGSGRIASPLAVRSKNWRQQRKSNPQVPEGTPRFERGGLANAQCCHGGVGRIRTCMAG